MRFLRLLRARLHALVRRDVIAGEIRDELEFHLQSRIEQYEREGCSPEDARRKALGRVGNLAVHQDRGYDVRGGGVMETIVQDVRYACRQLLRHPGFAAVSILTLALGIGAMTAIFTVIDAALLRPLPFPDPERLVLIEIETERPGRGLSRHTPSQDDLRRMAASSAFSAVAVWRNVMFGRIVEGPEPERVNVREVAGDLPAVHGLAAVVGRGFTREDLQPGAPPVIMLGHGYWLRRFGGDPANIGQTLKYDDGVTTIVGVMPPEFGNTEIWRPLPPFRPDQDRWRGWGGRVYARLQPGMTPEDAEGRLAGTLLPDERSGLPGTARVTSLLEDTRVDYSTTVGVLGGVTALILLLACVNVAGLLLARGATRQSELAIRASLGAGRLRLARQLLTESVVLSLAGCAAGILLAWLTLDMLLANFPVSMPSGSPATLNMTVLGATAALTVITGVLFGLAPAVRLSRAHITPALARGNPRHGSLLSRRGGQFLVAAEVALAVVLVAGGGLMIRSFARLLTVDIGFDPGAIVTIEARPLDPAAQGQFYPELLRRLRDLPEVESAGAVDHFSLGFSATSGFIVVDGRQIVVGTRQYLPGYFEALGLDLREGRLPIEADYASGRRAAVINERAAREMFDGPAAGRRFTVGRQDFEVLAVVADMRHHGPLRSVGPEVFLPFTASDHHFHNALGMTVVVRPRGRVPDLAERLRRAAQDAAPRVLVERIRSGRDWYGDTVSVPRSRTVLLGLLGGLGLALALVGVFGMTAYAVARRAIEIGVRMAFGARPGQVVAQMVRDTAIPIALGTIAGIAGALAATRVIASFLFQTEPDHPLTLAAVALTLGVAGCLAAWLPARRAASVDPVAALRTE
jgi:predicted permease